MQFKAWLLDISTHKHALSAFICRSLPQPFFLVYHPGVTFLSLSYNHPLGVKIFKSICFCACHDSDYFSEEIL